MTKTLLETTISEIAERYGLAVFKRVQTGNFVRHFADFEVTGERVLAAWPEFRAFTEGPKAILDHVDNQEHPDYGKAFISIQSVWCELPV